MLSETIPEDQTEYASLLLRVIGTFIDGVIFGIMFYLTIVLLNKYNFSNAFSICFVILFYYSLFFVWPIAAFAQTLGCMLVKIKVIKSDGTNLGIVASFFRYIVKYFLGFISWLTYGFSKKRQCMHDMMVDSIVVCK